MNIEFEMVVCDNPVISMMAMMEKGYRFEAVDMECMYDREGEEGDKGPDAE